MSSRELNFVCPLCSKIISNPESHVTNYHNFTDPVARTNFLHSEFFVFKKVFSKREEVEGQTLAAKATTSTTTTTATATTTTNDEKLKSQPHFRCKRFSCKYCNFNHHIESALEKHIRRRHLDDVINSNQKYHWNEETLRVVMARLFQVEQFLSSSDQKPIKSVKSQRAIKTYKPFKAMTVPATHTALMEATKAPKVSEYGEVCKSEYNDLSYGLGELVFARCTGHPWWPGMVVRIPTATDSDKYQIMFFEDDKTTTAFVKQTRIKTFARSPDEDKKVKMTPKQKHRLEKAFSWADFTLSWSNQERLDYFLTKKSRVKTEKTSIGGHPVETGNEQLSIGGDPIETGIEKSAKRGRGRPKKIEIKTEIDPDLMSGNELSGNINLKNRIRLKKIIKTEVADVSREIAPAYTTSTASDASPLTSTVADHITTATPRDRRRKMRETRTTSGPRCERTKKRGRGDRGQEDEDDDGEEEGSHENRHHWKKRKAENWNQEKSFFKDSPKDSCYDQIGNFESYNFALADGFSTAEQQPQQRHKQQQQRHKQQPHQRKKRLENDGTKKRGKNISCQISKADSEPDPLRIDENDAKSASTDDGFDDRMSESRFNPSTDECEGVEQMAENSKADEGRSSRCNFPEIENPEDEITDVAKKRSRKEIFSTENKTGLSSVRNVDAGGGVENGVGVVKGFDAQKTGAVEVVDSVVRDTDISKGVVDVVVAVGINSDGDQGNGEAKDVNDEDEGDPESENYEQLCNDIVDHVMTNPK